MLYMTYELAVCYFQCCFYSVALVNAEQATMLVLLHVG